MKKIIGKKIEKKKIFYLVNWEGYNEEDNTWEPAENLLEDNLD